MNDVKDEPYGTPVPAGPTTTMWADTSQLYASAYAWEWDVATGLSAAAFRAGAGLGQGHLCGLAMHAVWACHDAFVEHTVDQLRVGAEVARELGTRLRATADDWVRTDDGAAEAQHRMRSRL